jgi:hypothetical protein
MFSPDLAVVEQVQLPIFDTLYSVIYYKRALML